MATLNILDINGPARVLRGSIGTVAGVSTAITWFDLGNPGAIAPFTNRLGGPAQLAVSVESTTGALFNMTVVVVVSLQDATPPSTPAGATITASNCPWPILGTITSQLSQQFTLNSAVRWVGLNCPAWVSGSATGWVYGTLPGR